MISPRARALGSALSALLSRPSASPIAGSDTGVGQHRSSLVKEHPTHSASLSEPLAVPPVCVRGVASSFLGQFGPEIRSFSPAPGQTAVDRLTDQAVQSGQPLDDSSQQLLRTRVTSPLAQPAGLVDVLSFTRLGAPTVHAIAASTQLYGSCQETQVSLASRLAS